MKRLILTLVFVVGLVQFAHATVYVREDSLKVVSLLKKGASQPRGTNLMLFFAHQFVGKPYVSRTLEVNRNEDLAVNLGQMDCTTLVETVTALTLTTRQGSLRWDDFLHWLKTIRYRGGELNGYCSRNHYFSQWIQSNERLGLVQEISADGFPFTATRRLQLHYMSRHPASYPMLRGNSKELKTIIALEREASGALIRYIPCHLLGHSASSLKYIQDGDILAIVTKRDGLDVSHVGLAEWGKDGKVHLLNASTIHKRVVLESLSLHQYMLRHPSQLGIRVIRIK